MLNLLNELFCSLNSFESRKYQCWVLYFCLPTFIFTSLGCIIGYLYYFLCIHFSHFVSTCVSSDNSFPSVRREPSFGPWKGSLFLQQTVTLVGLFFTETDILTTRVLRGQLACQWTRPSGHNWDPFVPGLLLMRTTGQLCPWPECPDQ